MRNGLVATLAGCVLLVPTVPARAQTALLLTCTVQYTPGPDSADGPCTVMGTMHGAVYSTTATISYAEAVLPTLPLCLDQASRGDLWIDSWVHAEVYLVRYGSVVFVTTAGDISASGVGTYVVTSPVGNSCGAYATALLVVSLVGA